MLKLVRDICTANGRLGYIDLPAGKITRIFTLERPWVPAGFTKSASSVNTLIPCGVKGVSCIPPGIYDLERHFSEAHPDTLALINRDLWVYHFPSDVPPDQRGYARTAVLIHPANYVEELRGCIAPGLTRRELLTPVVIDSRKAFDLLLPYLRQDPHLEIVE